MDEHRYDRSRPGDLVEQVRARYGSAAAAVLESEVSKTTCCSGNCETEPQTEDWSGSTLYEQVQRDDLPVAAVAASLGCGNPTVVAALVRGERVLDLGSGGGIDVLLSAERVGPSGFVYSVDMTPEMLQLARQNADKAGAENVEFLEGTIEDVPLPDASVDVVISNCVINLSLDKTKVLAEMYRVLVPGGRIGISDVVAEDHLSPVERAERGAYTGCIAGALTRRDYLDGLAAVGFEAATVTFTHPVAEEMHAAIIQATKPG